jgi:hypothetical protein
LSDSTNFGAKLKAWALDKSTAMFAQRIGTLPAKDLDAKDPEKGKNKWVQPQTIH